jgi:hypothetical protein
MASKSVLDRQRVGRAIVAAARTHAQEVGERLQQILAANLTDGEPQSTRGRRDEVIERFDQAVGGVARTLRGWCLLAGLPTFASMIRLTPPKRRAVSDSRGKEG